MLMTKEEYKRFKAQYELMGELEDERQKCTYESTKSFHKFLEFLDEAYFLLMDNSNVSRISDKKMKGKIALRQYLYKYRDISFDKF